jgi:hypothetical protein
MWGPQAEGTFGCTRVLLSCTHDTPWYVVVCLVISRRITPVRSDQTRLSLTCACRTQLPISISQTGSTGTYVRNLEAYVRPPVLGKVERAQAEGAFHGL